MFTASFILCFPPVERHWGSKAVRGGHQCPTGHSSRGLPVAIGPLQDRLPVGSHEWAPLHGRYSPDRRTQQVKLVTAVWRRLPGQGLHPCVGHDGPGTAEAGPSARSGGQGRVGNLPQFALYRYESNNFFNMSRILVELIAWLINLIEFVVDWLIEIFNF